MKIHQIIFSPTGGTERVCQYLVDGIALDEEIGTTVDLCSRAEAYEIPNLAADDITVIGMPVYAGRIPPPAKERLLKMRGNKSLCVVVGVYGNRAYDDALIEMGDVAKECGFRVIAGVAAVAEHSIIRAYGEGRPDLLDRAVLREYGEMIAYKIGSSDFTVPAIPGDRPYREPSKPGPFPIAGGECTACGKCAEECPMGAIGDGGKVDELKCISCMRCIAVCPKGARSIGPALNIISEKLKAPCATRKKNEIFLTRKTIWE